MEQPVKRQRDPAVTLNMVRGFVLRASGMFCGPGEEAAAYVIDLIEGLCVCSAPIPDVIKCCPVHQGKK